MRRFLRENGLTLFFLALTLGALVAQALVGHSQFNHDQLAHQNEEISLARYVVSSSFAADVMENWQSEFLQTLLFVFATIWLVQKGSPESKALGDEGRKRDEDEYLGEHAREDSPRWATLGGIRTTIYENSLGLVVLLVFLGTWLAQAISTRVTYNSTQLDHQEAPLSFLTYLGSSDFWVRTLQNWQSEFLALAASAILAVYLRQRGSTQSKPVGMPHGATAAQED